MKQDKIAVTLTPGEAFTIQEELRLAQMVREAQKPVRGDVLRKASREAKAYTKLRDERVAAVSHRIGRAYTTHIRGKIKAGTGRARSAR